ncbi:hypothetical protein OGAPHI_005349 [Ogataea philodendri]|uniref:Uncharacterized protein n=1 Tax=Ogataea philodendri TaxID=1378263 RepID=A0A9P8P289_9ASCO|nr:uncharacterized protein OGAPHI_005349 [Ogataea philodendri]KAH3663359.1 hypothetical protein OGAPHI_005349 [Ogataea philodendri]
MIHAITSATTPTLTFKVNIGVIPLYSSAVMTGSVLSMKTNPPHSRQNEVMSSVNGLVGLNDFCGLLMLGHQQSGPENGERWERIRTETGSHVRRTVAVNLKVCTKLGVELLQSPVGHLVLCNNSTKSSPKIQECDRNMLQILGGPFTARRCQVLHEDVGASVKQDQRTLEHLHRNHTFFRLNLVQEGSWLFHWRNVRLVPSPAHLGPTSAISGKRDDSHAEEDASLDEMGQQVENMLVHSNAAQNCNSCWSLKIFERSLLYLCGSAEANSIACGVPGVLSRSNESSLRRCMWSSGSYKVLEGEAYPSIGDKGMSFPGNGIWLVLEGPSSHFLAVYTNALAT